MEKKGLGRWIRRGAMAAVLVAGAAQGTLAETPEKGAESREMAAAKVSGVVNINTATAAELELLPGVGPSRAEAIVAARKQRSFEKIEDIMRVKGIGRATFRALRPLLTTQGNTTLKPVAKAEGSKAAAPGKTAAAKP